MARRPDSKTKPPLSLEKLRALEVGRLRRRILRDSHPRLEMLLLVAFTALAGWLASFALLAGGLRAMGARYAAAVAIAYLVFLGMLWLWARWRTDASSAGDGPAGSGGDAPGKEFEGEGGRFGGGGASGDFQGVDAADVADLAGQGVVDAALDAGGGVLEAGADGEGCLLLPVLLVVAALVVVAFVASGSAFAVVASAPTLLAELLLDILLAAGLYRRLRRNPGRWWVETAVRHTFVPFAFALIALSGAGFALQHFAPDALTLGQAIEALRR